MDETQRLVWVLSMLICVDVNASMQEMTQVSYTSTSEQYIRTGSTRMERDLKDTQQVIRFLMDRNPFDNNGALYNIVTGITAAPCVNVDQSEEVGKFIASTMVDTNALEYSFKRKNQAVTMQTNVKVGEDVIHIDPQLLFQRHCCG